jgi:hypothetical protein
LSGTRKNKMSTQLHGYVIPRSRTFEVADAIRAEFLKSEWVENHMENDRISPYSVETHLQVFEIGHGRQFVRVVALSSASELPYPQLSPEALGAREVHYDDRAESLTRKDYAFCEKIDALLKARHYVLVPVFSSFIWNMHKMTLHREKAKS